MKYLIGFILGFIVCSVFNIYNNRPISPEDFMCSSISEASKDLDRYIQLEELNRDDFKGLTCIGQIILIRQLLIPVTKAIHTISVTISVT